MGDPLVFIYMRATQALPYLPVFVSLATLARLWWNRELFGTMGVLFIVWFSVAAIVQLAGPNQLVQLAGLLAQVALAIVLILKWRLVDLFPDGRR